MQSVNKYYINSLYRCKGTGFIPAHYQPCPRCRGQGRGVLRDCKLCDDLCYITEPWIACQVCGGSGKQGHLGDLSPDCTACRGVGYTKPGMGVGVGAGYGMPYGGGMVSPMTGAYPPVGGYPAPGGFPPVGGYQQVGGYYPGYAPACPPHY